MLPLEKLEHLARRYRDLDELLCRPDVLGDRNELAKLNKERGELEPLDGASSTATVRSRRRSPRTSRRANDPELRELVELELPELEREKSSLEESIQLLLLPPDPDERKNTILEIRSGEGGEEAALFAADLFRMYTRFAETLGWKVEVLNLSESATGGIKECIALVDREGRLRAAPLRGGRAPRAARAGDRDAGAHPHVDGDRRRAARGRRRRRAHRREGPRDHHRRERRAGRAGGQHDEQRRADPAQAERASS